MTQGFMETKKKFQSQYLYYETNEIQYKSETENPI
jgi:hypothetical protein